jgi:hypothetical protein
MASGDTTGHFASYHVIDVIEARTPVTDTDIVVNAKETCSRHE